MHPVILRQYSIDQDRTGPDLARSDISSNIFFEFWIYIVISRQKVTSQTREIVQIPVILVHFNGKILWSILTENILWSIWQKNSVVDFDGKNSVVYFGRKILWFWRKKFCGLFWQTNSVVLTKKNSVVLTKKNSVVDFDGKNYVVYFDRKILWSILTEKILWSFLTEKFCGQFWRKKFCGLF